MEDSPCRFLVSSDNGGRVLPIGNRQREMALAPHSLIRKGNRTARSVRIRTPGKWLTGLKQWRSSSPFGRSLSSNRFESGFGRRTMAIGLTARVARVSAFWPARYLDRNKFTLTYLPVCGRGRSFNTSHRLGRPLYRSRIRFVVGADFNFSILRASPFRPSFFYPSFRGRVLFSRTLVCSDEEYEREG